MRSYRWQVHPFCATSGNVVFPKTGPNIPLRLANLNSDGLDVGSTCKRMLRNVLEACQRAYTCSCHFQHAFASRSLQQSMRALTVGPRTFHTGPKLQTLDSEQKTKKIVSSAQQAEAIAEDDLLGIEGFTDSGITIPTEETSSMLIAGTRYDELPIVHIKSSLNNTIMIATDYTGKTKITRASCGTEGFRNVKKKTTVAAQATGLTIGNRIMKKGMQHVRVCVKGLGVGRLAAVKGLQMAGVTIVSLTDRTFVPHNGPKPRKARRV
ncbi:28S ribosomal protein S11, mitochondrial [Lamellibrachia satsuma]|nr:28S ribosomal protein S11, mitochondrial [Lamellibrachia satsuma]